MAQTKDFAYSGKDILCTFRCALLDKKRENTTNNRKSIELIWATSIVDLLMCENPCVYV